MAEQRTYQGHIYTRNSSDQPWQLAGPAPGVTMANPKFPLEVQHLGGENTLQAGQIARDPYVTAKTAAEARVEQARAATADQLNQAQLASAQAEAAERTRKNQEDAAADAILKMTPNSSVTGPAYLASLDPRARGIVSSLLQGNLPVGARGLTSPQLLPYIQAAINVDPTFSASTFAAKQKAITQLADAKSTGGYLASVGASIDHSGEMEDAIRGLHNPSGWLASHGGAYLNYKLNNEGRPADTTFAQANRVYSGELTKGIVGTVGSAGGNTALADRQEGEHALSPSMAQDSLFAGMRTGAFQLYQKLASADQTYARTMSGAHIPDIINPEQAKQLLHLMRLKDDGTEGPIPDKIAGDARFLALAGVAPQGGNGSGGNSGGGPSLGPLANGNPIGGAPTPQMGLATGATRTEADPQASALIDAGIRSGLTDDQINANLKAIGSNRAISASDAAAARAYLKANPHYTGSFGGATRDVPNPLIAQAAASPFGAYAINAADALTAGTLDNLTSNPAAARAGMEAVQAAHPTASLLGGITGSGLAAAGAETGLGALASRATGSVASILANPMTADAAYGAAYGAGSDDDNRIAGALLGGGAGAVGGVVGRRVGAAASEALQGVANPAIDYLRSQNIPLTVGQLLSQSGTAGRAVKGVEDRLTGIPGVGAVINARRREGLDAFNRAAFDQALAPINATTNGLTAEAGIDAARAARSQAYSNALDPVTLNPDGQFLADLGGADTAAAALPADMAARGGYALDRAAENVDANAQLSGDGLQQAMRRFRRTTNENAQLPNGYDLGQVMNQGEQAYTDLAARQAPEVIPALMDANAANRNVSVLKDAVNAARNNEGMFMPSQLTNAAAANARRFGDTAGTTAQPFFDLTRAAQPVLPSKVSDSGTAGRLAVQALLGLSGASGLGYAAGGSEGAEGATGAGLGVAAALALGGTRTGQSLLTRALVDRPQTMVNLGQRIAAQNDIARLLGAGLGSEIVPYAEQ